MSKPFLSVIIPAYNEEKRLPETLQKVRGYLTTQKFTWEVLIVDDGSRDRMKEVVTNLIASWPNFRLISYPKNRGKGYAVKTGMLEAKGEWRLLMDADNSTDISELEKLWNACQHHQSTDLNFPSEKIGSKRSARPEPCASPPRFTSDDIDAHSSGVIIGSRYLDNNSIKVRQPLTRRIVSRIGNIIVRVLLGLKPLDTQCGFKLFSAQAATEIFPRQTINRWGFDVEILSIAVHYGYDIKEVAVDWYDAEGSRVKKTAIFKTLNEIYTIKLNMMRGKYDRGK